MKSCHPRNRNSTFHAHTQTVQHKTNLVHYTLRIRFKYTAKAFNLAPTAKKKLFQNLNKQDIPVCLFVR